MKKTLNVHPQKYSKVGATDVAKMTSSHLQRTAPNVDFVCSHLFPIVQYLQKVNQDLHRFPCHLVVENGRFEMAARRFRHCLKHNNTDVKVAERLVEIPEVDCVDLVLPEVYHFLGTSRWIVGDRSKVVGVVVAAVAACSTGRCSLGNPMVAVDN